MERSNRIRGMMFGLVSLALLALDALIFFEVIRPFRDNNIDQPIGLCLAGLGALLAAFALWRRQGPMALNIIALLLNITALILVGLIAWSLSHMKLM